MQAPLPEAYSYVRLPNSVLIGNDGSGQLFVIYHVLVFCQCLFSHITLVYAVSATILPIVNGISFVKNERFILFFINVLDTREYHMYVKEKCIFIHAYLKLRQARQKQVWKSRRVALNAMQHQTQRGHKKSPLFLWRFACGDLFVVEDPKLWEMPGRRSYSTEFKLKVIERYHELNDNVSLCATEFKITRREIQRWRSQYDKLRDLTAMTRKHGKTMRRRRRLDYAKT